MFNAALFDAEIDKLLQQGKTQEAEKRLLRAYLDLKEAGGVDNFEYVISRLASYYSMPDSEDLKKAESYFLEREAVSCSAYAKTQTAMFYFYIAQEPQKTIAKVDEIRDRKGDVSSYYTSLALKGHALLKLEMIAEANKVLTELLILISATPSGLPLGDEMNLLEAAMEKSLLASNVREILKLILPKIRTKEYRARAEALLKSENLGNRSGPWRRA